LNGSTILGDDFSWLSSLSTLFLFFRRRNNSDKSITAIIKTTPPTAPPAIAPVGVPLCSPVTLGELDPPGCNELLGADELEEPVATENPGKDKLLYVVVEPEDPLEGREDDAPKLDDKSEMDEIWGVLPAGTAAY